MSFISSPFPPTGDMVATRNLATTMSAHLLQNAVAVVGEG